MVARRSSTSSAHSSICGTSTSPRRRCFARYRPRPANPTRAPSFASRTHSHPPATSAARSVRRLASCTSTLPRSCGPRASPSPSTATTPLPTHSGATTADTPHPHPGTPRRDASPRPATPQGHAAPLRDLVPSALLAGPCRPRRHRRLFRFPRRLRCTIPPESPPPTPPTPGARSDPPPLHSSAPGARLVVRARPCIRAPVPSVLLPPAALRVRLQLLHIRAGAEICP